MEAPLSLSDYLYDFETEHQLAYYVGIGRVFVVWSALEFQWDVCIWQLWENIGGRAICSKMPRSMRPKLEFWSTCFQKLPTLSQRTEAAAQFKDRMESATEIRNRLFHASWGNILSEGHSDFVPLASLRAIKTDFHHEGFCFSLDDLHAFLVEIGNLQLQLLPLSSFLIDLGNNLRNRSDI